MPPLLLRTKSETAVITARERIAASRTLLLHKNRTAIQHISLSSGVLKYFFDLTFVVQGFLNGLVSVTVIGSDHQTSWALFPSYVVGLSCVNNGSVCVWKKLF